MAAHPGSCTLHFIQVLLALTIPDSIYSIQEYEFSALCRYSTATYIDLSSYEFSAFVTLPWVNYISNMDCLMHVTAKPSHMIAVKFVKFDVHWSDSLNLYDGPSFFVPKIGSYCGSTNFSDVSTTGNELLIDLKTNQMGDKHGFKLLITAFKTGYCDTDNGAEFKCNNGRCIDFELYCNGEDNCGDNSGNSDDCHMDQNWWIWVIVGIVVFLVICVIITVICCYCCKRSRPGSVVNTNQGVAVHHNTGMQTAGTTTASTTPGVNPWYGTPTSQPQYQPQNFYQPPQGLAQPPPFSAPPPLPAPPPSYTSLFGAPMYPAEPPVYPAEPVNPKLKASAPVLTP